MRDRYGSTIGVRARATALSASGVWSLREQMTDVGNAVWPSYDPILSTSPTAYWDFSDPTSLRVNGGATAPTSATPNVSVTPQDKGPNALHLINYQGLPTWTTGLQNGKSGAYFTTTNMIYRNATSQFTNMHKSQSTMMFVFWPGASGTTPSESNQSLFSTNGQTSPSYAGAGFQVSYINTPAFGNASAISYISANNGTAAAVFCTPSNTVPTNRFSIVTVITDVENAVASERVKIYIDGGGATYKGNTSLSASYKFVGNILFMGAYNSTACRFGQIMFWDSILPASTLNGLHSFLSEYWAIPVTSF